MAIESVSLYQQYQPQFLGVTSRAPQGSPEQTQGYHQAAVSGAVPNTTPQISPSYKPTQEDFELAQAVIDSGIGLNPFNAPSRAASVGDPRGSAFDGFSVPQNNGTGELQPTLAGREDEISDCPWREYYA